MASQKTQESDAPDAKPNSSNSSRFALTMQTKRFKSIRSMIDTMTLNRYCIGRDCWRATRVRAWTNRFGVHNVRIVAGQANMAVCAIAAPPSRTGDPSVNSATARHNLIRCCLCVAFERMDRAVCANRSRFVRCAPVVGAWCGLVCRKFGESLRSLVFFLLLSCWLLVLRRYEVTLLFFRVVRRGWRRRRRWARGARCWRARAR